MGKLGHKAYVLDTNIILSDVSTIEMIGNENIIVIPETVLEEIDKYKKGNEEKNYQAREFARLVADAQLVKKTDNYLIVQYNNVKLVLLENRSTDPVNDNKIIETVSNFKDLLYSLADEIIFISNDINFRTKCLLRGFEVQPLLIYKEDEEIVFEQEFENIDEILPNKEYFKLNELEPWTNNEVSEYTTLLKITDSTRRQFLFYREDHDTVKRVNDSYPTVFGIKPKNLGQKIFFEAIVNPKNDIIVVDAKAGSGKTAIALVAALHLINTNKNRYNKITYIRRTIISGDSFDEIGFLPGSQDEKLRGYLHPLRDNIEMLVKNRNKKKKKWTADDLFEAVKDFENEFNIEYQYEGHLRGRNLDGIIILDEAQNDSIANIKTILSRVREGSKVIIIGSTRQIDHPYLNKYNNALAFMKKQCNTNEPIRIQGWKMEKVERGKIVDWVESLDI